MVTSPNSLHYSLTQRYHRDLFWVTLILCFVTLVGTYFINFSTVNNAFYAQALQLTSARPAAKDIVLIVIDDKSLNEIGRWPWRRFIHGQLLAQLKQAKVVGFDITFLDESSEPSDDAFFANAIEKHGRVVLSNYLNAPLNTEPIDPYPPFRTQAKELGYINIPIDSDGLVRRVQLTTPLPNGDLALHFSLALLKAADEQHVLERYVSTELKYGTFQAHELQRLIPFAGPPNHFQTVSYSDVLNLRVSEDFFADKYVIIGAWATGLGDKFPTPTTSQSLNMSGVEILTTILQSNIENSWNKEATKTTTLLFSLAWVLLYCFFMHILSPRSALFAGLILGVLSLLSSLLTLYLWQLFIPISPVLLGLAFTYPLWTWRAQELALYQMDHEIEVLNHERPLLAMEHAHPHPPSILQGRNTFTHHLSELRSALARVRNLRQFISDSFNGMPYATAVFDNDSKLSFATQVADEYFEKLGHPSLVSDLTLKQFLDIILDNPEKVASLMTCLLAFRIPQKILPTALPQSLPHDTAPNSSNTNNTNNTGNTSIEPDSPDEAIYSNELEFTDKKGHDILLKFANTYTSNGDLSGFIITLIDISAIRNDERRREETIRFISHDMRSPQSSIQALIKMQQNPQTAIPQEQFLQQINSLSQNTLHLVDNFLFLARAGNTEYTLVPVNLVDILSSAIDNFWAIGKTRNIKINFTPSEFVYFTLADESLMKRVFSNLIDNAIKYGVDGMQIFIDIKQQGDNCLITIADQGIGIAQKDFDALFKSFSRIPQAQNKAISGLGLGLAFVHTVITRHGGTITLESQEGKGTCFYIELPLLLEDDDEPSLIQNVAVTPHQTEDASTHVAPESATADAVAAKRKEDTSTLPMSSFDPRI